MTGPYQREFERRLNVGIIGVGSHSYRNILPVMNYLPVRIKAMCDFNVEIVKAAAEQYNCNWYKTSAEMYSKEKLDAVFIAVGPAQHPALIREALEHHVNVWCEKPIATRASQVKELIGKRGDTIVVVGLKKAFMPACSKVMEICGSEEYGYPWSMLATYPLALEANGEELMESKELPNWLRNGVHPLSFMVQIGGRAKAVTAITSDLGFGSVVIEFANGCIGTLQLCSGPKPDFETYSFYGDGWKIDVDNSVVTLDRGIPFEYGKTTSYIPEGFDSGKLVWTPGDCVATLESKSLFTQGFYNETSYFCNCVLENRQPERGTLELAYEIMLIYEAAYRSHGKRIEIEGSLL